MPAVPVGQRGLVGALDQAAPADRLEHEEVARVRLVPAGEDAVDGAHAALGTDDHARPALARAHLAVLRGDALERAHDRGADGDHPARGVDRRGGAGRYAEALGVGRLPELERGDAGVEHDRGDGDAAVLERLEHPRAERPAGARHLGAAGLVGEDGLIVGQRPRGRRVPVADRPAVAGQVVEHRLAEPQARGPQAPAAEVRGEQLQLGAAGQRQALAGTATAVRSGAVAELDDPALVAVVRPAAPGRLGERRGEMHPEAVPALDRRGEGRGGVDDEQVARLEQVGEVEEGGVADARARRHEHAHPVALGRRLGRLQPLGQLEGERRAHAGATAPAW